MMPPATPPTRRAFALVILAGILIGSGLSILVAERHYPWGPSFDHYLATLLLSPLLMTVGTFLAAQHLPPAFGLMMFAGVGLTLFGLAFMRKRNRFASLAACLLGPILWSLGNATAFYLMMSV